MFFIVFFVVFLCFSFFLFFFIILIFFFFFFFSSRRRHTRCGRDWSSDVCSSDLVSARIFPCTTQEDRRFKIGFTSPLRSFSHLLYENISFEGPSPEDATERSEERRVGKECRSERWRNN